MELEKKHILFLPAWYTSKEDKFFGLFVERHVEAVSLFNDISVVYAILSNDSDVKYRVEKGEEDFASVYRIYYKDSNIPLLRKFIKTYRFFKACKLGIDKVKDENEIIDLVHVNILSRMGIVASHLKRKHNIPYIITEHWSRYFPENNSFKGFFRKKITKKVVKDASMVLTVSEKLKNSMQMHSLFNKDYRIINNVIHPAFFQQYPQKGKSEKIRLLNVTTFDEASKNLKGMLDAIKILSTKRKDFGLTIIGDSYDENIIKEYCSSLSLNDIIVFKNSMDAYGIAEEMNNADLFLMTSNYETFGIAFIEAMACKLPIVSTKVGVLQNMESDFMAVLTAGFDASNFADAINSAIENIDSFDKEKMRGIAQNEYSYAAVGDKLTHIYKEVIDGE